MLQMQHALRQKLSPVHKVQQTTDNSVYHFSCRGTHILRHKRDLMETHITKRWLLSVMPNRQYVSQEKYRWFGKTLKSIKFYRNASGCVQSIKNKRIMMGSGILMLFCS